MIKSYKAVIFDLGQVLFRWNPRGVAQTLRAQDQTFNTDIYKITQTPFWQQFDLGQISLQEIIDYFSKDFPKASLELFFTEVKRNLLPYEFGVGLLKQIQAKQIPTYLLSNLPGEFHTWLIPRHSFLQSFKGTVYSFQIQLAKPDPKIYLHLLEKYQLNPEKCLFLDDLEININAAKQLGIDGIVFQDEEHVINKLKQFSLI